MTSTVYPKGVFQSHLKDNNNLCQDFSYVTSACSPQCEKCEFANPSLLLLEQHIRSAHVVPASAPSMGTTPMAVFKCSGCDFSTPHSEIYVDHTKSCAAKG